MTRECIKSILRSRACQACDHMVASRPEVADGCKFKFKSCAYISISGCCMSLSWASKPVRYRQELRTPILGSGYSDHVLAQASQTHWPVAVYEHPGRGSAITSGPCPYASLLRVCCGAKALLHSLRLPNFFGDGPEAADGCKSRSCAHTPTSRCLMSLSRLSGGAT